MLNKRAISRCKWSILRNAGGSLYSLIMDIIFHRTVLNYFDDIARQAGSAYFNITLR